MKNIVIVLLAVFCAVCTQAACVDWKVTGTSADVGTTVYLLTSIEGLDSIDALSEAAFANADVIRNGRAYDTKDQNAVGTRVTSDSMKDVYFVIVSDDGKSFYYVQADLSEFVYDPANQDTSPGQFSSFSVSDIKAGTNKTFGGSGGVPEPTSGLLFLVGGAMLALRRKQK